MSTSRTALLLLLLLAGAASGAAAQARRAPANNDFSFVVIGHVRGNRGDLLNPKMNELLDKVRALNPDLIVLSGDNIWGDHDFTPARGYEVEREWNALDSALGTLHLPIFRSPGNHDIGDITSRKVWERRYGPLPTVKTFGGSRFIMLWSPYHAPDRDTATERMNRGVDLDSAQIAFLRRALTGSGYAHTFVFLGHQSLWWEDDDGPWWRQVHPLLAAAHVDNVFSGDYAPIKWSTKLKDGVRYFHSSIEFPISLIYLQINDENRVLSAQFDSFFHVRVHGDTARVTVHTLGEISGNEFTPERYKAIRSDIPFKWRLRPMVDTPKKKAGLVGLVVLGWLAGWLMRGRFGSQARSKD